MLKRVLGEVRPSKPLSGTLTPGQVARLSGIPRRTVCHWLLDGTIAGHRSPTGRWWVPRSELERLKSGAFDARFARDDD